MAELVCHKASDTINAGLDLGKRLAPGTVVCLYGPLGSGKTTFTKGIAAALGIEDEVTSPTFTIVQRYDGSSTMYHVDLYRIGKEAEIDELGMDDILRQDTISVIEWPEKMRSLLPDNPVQVSFRILPDQSRAISITGI
jgi:tRNA threonylcarbamoyladenosine biosynthesis protein TsaE